jgi:deoxyadenosine/deoxycytidine kinase
VLEEFADNPFLPKFYENPKLYAFPLELFFMAERYKQLKDLIQQKDLFQNITISDYLFTKCLLFAKVNLPKMSFVFINDCSRSYISNCYNPIFLFICILPVSRLQKNIKKRNRPYEQNIPDEYLFNIQQTYTHYIKDHNIKHFSLMHPMPIFLVMKNI